MNIFGGTNAASILSSLTYGVQNTGADFWPLFSLVGIALAFMIAKYVVDFVKKATGDRSFSIGGFYVRDVPYAGYNRWHSRAWNMRNTA